MRADAATISLGSAHSFAALASATVTNAGASVVTGQVGVAPGTSITGFQFATQIGGTLHSNDALSIEAIVDAQDAYDEMGLIATATDLTGQDLGNRTLTPGVYRFSSSAQLTGTLTLDGLGQASPEFIFLVGSSLTTASGSSILPTNGADALLGVFFRMEESATLGTGTTFAGNIIAGDSVTLTTGASVLGSVIALGGAVTLGTNIVTIPESSSSALIAVAMAAFLGRRRRRVA
ncbi:ice-binding family protein [Luteolibacter arcticus]|uniref:Ice-binding family protein n=1 Tax=Luteolibacter arcticus TaxID=1581411 RepID=A0ABT3GCA4_9BACT|nr:ice-binding family protein [Luteolibacter arcticus]MCW1921043.1 ice-binding family protein [Luteolibacter arcticus]